MRRHKLPPGLMDDLPDLEPVNETEEQAVETENTNVVIEQKKREKKQPKNPVTEIKDEQFEPAPDSPTRRRGTTVLTYDEVVAMRDKLQALDDSKEALSNVRYPIGMVLQELRALAFRMEHEKLVEVRA